MLYIYDILLNFSDSARVLEFFEWDNKDVVEHIKKIPIFKVSPNIMKEIFSSNIVVAKDFLEEIYNLTEYYKNKETIMYACIFTDTSKALAIEFNEEGNSLYKSTFLIDEEEDIIDSVSGLEEYNLNYKVKSKPKLDYYSTREELFKKNYLFCEIKNLYLNKTKDKFNYLYLEIFANDDLTFTERYHKFISDIKNNYSAKYNNLYEIVRLSYSKK